MTLDEIKTKWIEELRSGKHTQIRSDLLDGEGGYCCLGVLACEVLGADITKDAENQGYNVVRDAFKSYRFEPSRYWKLNDHLKMSFEEIANVIEEEDWNELYPEVED